MEPADKIGFFLFGFTFGIIAGVIITVLNLVKDVDTNRFYIGDNVYCQEAIDNPIGDWRVGRIEYIGDNQIYIVGGITPVIPDDKHIYGEIMPYKGWIGLDKYNCKKVEFYN